MTSKSKEIFDIAMKDVEQLVELYDELNEQPDRPNMEVLKRSAFIMAFTAWETYVEDRAREFVKSNIKLLMDSQIAKYLESRLESDLKHFHNPNSSKTKKLFEDLIGDDITESWTWPNFEAKRVREDLNRYISMRGESVHRAVVDKQETHVIKRKDIDQCIRLITNITECMEESLAE